MATSTCPKCPSNSFEAVDLKVTGTKYTLKAIQCVKCGAVVGVLNEVDLMWQIQNAIHTK